MARTTPKDKGKARDRLEIRLFINDSLSEGREVSLTPDQTHYLCQVMRVEEGARMGVFNGREGEWAAELVKQPGKVWAVRPVEQRRPQRNSPDLWLYFALVKAGPVEFMMQKAAELGAARLIPVLTRYGQVRRINGRRLQAILTEAAEQCGRLDLPVLEEPLPLAEIGAHAGPERLILHGDESGVGHPLAEVLAGQPQGRALAVLTGPEGGFAPEEREMLTGWQNTVSFTMGPRILRAETAALAALAGVQMLRGDWDEKPRFEPPSGLEEHDDTDTGKRK